MTKTILSYPGGKSFAKEHFLKYFENEKEVASIFAGGGSIELELASQGKRVYCYDAFPQLVTFYHHLLNNKEELYYIVSGYYNAFKNPSNNSELKSMFNWLKNECLTNEYSVYTAAAFYVVNKTSFSGLTLLGGLSKAKVKDFSQSIIDRLIDFNLPDLSVELLTFEKSIEKHKNTMLYLDPPYLIKDCLYGTGNDNLHKGFNHTLLRDILAKRDKWVLCYNDCKEIREMYKDYKIIIPQWRYRMSNKSSKEIIILSNDISKKGDIKMNYESYFNEEAPAQLEQARP